MAIRAETAAQTVARGEDTGTGAGGDLGALMSQLDAIASNPTGTMPVSSSSAPLLWMGSMGGKTPIGGSHGAIYAPGPSTTYLPVDADSAVLQMQGWSDKQLTSFKQLLMNNGFEPQSYEDMATAWQTAVQAAVQSWAAYEKGIIDKPLTPEEAIRQMGKQQAALFGDEEGEGPETTTFSQTNSSVDQLSQQEARGQAFDAAQAFLGRGPRKGEVADYRSGYNAAEESNPSVTHSSGASTASDGHTETSSSSRTTGGIDQQTYQREWAMSRPDFSEFRAASQFMDALVSAIGRQVGG